MDVLLGASVEGTGASSRGVEGESKEERKSHHAPFSIVDPKTGHCKLDGEVR